VDGSAALTPLRRRIIAHALAWDGTPYARGQQVRGIGADCVAIVWTLYRDLYGGVPGWPRYGAVPAPYAAVLTQAWSCAHRAELLRELLAATMPRLVPIALATAQPGDVLLTGAPGEPANHVAFLVAADLVLHARLDPNAQPRGGRIMCERRHAALQKTERGALLLLPPETEADGD
jgi:cell wall-associated NlpC family hydrolase